MFMCDSMLGKVLHSTVNLRGLCWVKKKVVFSNAKKKEREEKQVKRREKRKKNMVIAKRSWRSYGQLGQLWM